ncbi:MAG: hypothetical protein EOP46_16970 [Sphingobacteriaceae bacterium]|nr:MAG: hypothetical protein EOP46_16970 [Sphingobacteriaceae bacterium]
MKTFEYSLKTWQTSVLLSPVIITIYLCITQYEPEPLSFILTAIVIGIIYSFPGFMVFALACRWVMSRNRTLVQQKSLMSLIGIGLTLFAFYLYYTGIFIQGIMPDFILYITVYSSTIVSGIWLFKFDPAASLTAQDLCAG